MDVSRQENMRPDRMLPTKVRMASLGLEKKGIVRTWPSAESYAVTSLHLEAAAVAVASGPRLAIRPWPSPRGRDWDMRASSVKMLLLPRGRGSQKRVQKGVRGGQPSCGVMCVCRERSVESVRWGFGDGDGRDKTGWAGRVGGKMLSVVLPPRQVRAGFRVVCGGWRCAFVPPFSFQESRVWSVPEPRSKERPGLSGHSKPIREEELLCCPPRDDLFYFLAKIWRIPSFDDLVPTECGCVNVGIASPQTSSVHDRAETARARFRCCEDETGCPLGILTVPRSRMRKEGVSEARLAMS